MAAPDRPDNEEEKLRRTGGKAADGPGGGPDWLPEDVLARTVVGLTGCGGESAHSKAVCRGIIDPDEVIAWVDRTERLIRFKGEQEELRAEIPLVAEGLARLLEQVELPTNTTPQKATLDFIEKLVTLRELVSDDVEAAFNGDPAARGHDEIVVSYPSIRVLAIHRIAHELFRQQIPLLPRIMSEYAHDRTGIDIHPGATIGRHFFIDHGTGVVIGETAEIGDRVRIYQGVTIGAISLRNAAKLRGVKRHPTVEDDVTIYAGAKLLGGDTVIGAGSVIGGNVWLTESVPPNSRVMAEPPRHMVQKGEIATDEPMQLDWEI